jgi:predicted dinucleotide-binding enzyme
MKKFTLLAIGDAFEFQGEQYTKTGPLTASRLENGSQRMIPRSAVVAPLSGAQSPATEIEAKQLPAEQVLEAFEHYHKGCVEWLAMTEKVDAALAASIREAMETARERFLAELKKL